MLTKPETAPQMNSKRCADAFHDKIAYQKATLTTIVIVIQPQKFPIWTIIK